MSGMIGMARNTSALPSFALQRGLQYICQVLCGPASALPDLLAAAEAICHDDGFGRRASDRWQQHTFTDRLRYRGPASPQQPASGHSRSTPMRRNSDSSSFIFISALW